MEKISLNKIQKAILYASIPLISLIGASYFYDFDMLGWLTYRPFSQEERDRCLKDWEAKDKSEFGRKFRFTPPSCNTSRPNLISLEPPVLRKEKFKEVLLLFLMSGGVVGILLVLTKDIGGNRRK